MSTSDEEYNLEITVYGAKENDVEPSLKKHLAPSEEPHTYSTWVHVGAMKRLAFLFEGGVESAGGIFEILCVFVIMAAVVGLFAFYQIVVFFVVIVVLTVLSGGAAIKYVRSTKIQTMAERVETGRLESFVDEQLREGRFVSIKSEEDISLSDRVWKSDRASDAFRYGILISLFVATGFLIVEVFHWFFFQSWMTEVWFLAVWGIAFLVGVAFMDVGVVWRHNLAKHIGEAYKEHNE
ncbi:hypothetical protein EU538_08635 [Candidatus Thorarchaeota archaeon]|nr:MAG: hypothetical protein EU538_08635 [Candidatus Thorarchaeota archaeon]